MKKALTLLLLLCTMCIGAEAQTAFRAHRYDVFKSMPINNQSIVFVGNSITNMHPWVEAFGNDPRIVNRGNSGGTSGEILANVRSYCVGKPAKIFLMIGINDRPSSSNRATIVSNIQQTIATIKEVSPSTKIYQQSILPSGSYSSLAEISACNQAIQDMLAAQGYTDVTYVDLYSLLLGKVDTKTANGITYSYDALHMTAAGYEIWTNKLLEYLAEDGITTTAYPANTGSLQHNPGAGTDSFGARCTYFSMFPIATDDVLFFGDEMVHGGEWHELLGNAHVKNRGTNWGYDSGASITRTGHEIDATFHAVTGVTKQSPKQVLIYTGTSEVNGSTSLSTILESYKTVVNKVRTYAPTTKISLVSLMPTTTSGNARVREFNDLLRSYAYGETNVEYIDIFSALSTNNNVNTVYFPNNDNMIHGKGYVAVANVLADHIEGCNPVTPQAAQTYRAEIEQTPNIESGIYEFKNVSNEGGNGIGRGYLIDYTAYANGPAIGNCEWTTSSYNTKHPSEKNDNSTTCSYWYVYNNGDGTYCIFTLSNLGSKTAPRFLKVGNQTSMDATWQSAPVSLAIDRSTRAGNSFTPAYSIKTASESGNKVYLSMACSYASASGAVKCDAITDGGCPLQFISVDESELSDAQKQLMADGIALIEGSEEPEPEPTTEITEGWYQIQVGDGSAFQHAEYKGKYIYANPHVNGNYTWAMGLTDDANDLKTYVYITGSAGNWHMEFNHGTPDAYYAAANCTKSASPANLSFIPNADNTQWKIWGNNTNRWIGWNIGGPSVGSTGTAGNDSYDNCYFIFKKVTAVPISVTYTFKVGEETIGTVVRNERQGAAPTISDIIPSYFVEAQNLPDVVEESAYTINTTYKATMPFSVGGTYNIKFKVKQNGNPTYYWYNNGTEAKEYGSGTNPTVYKSADQWCVEGNWLDGYSFRSLSDNRYITAQSAASHNQKTTLNTSKTELSKFVLKNKADGNYFQIKNGTSYLAHTSSTTLAVTTWNVENYVGNMVDFVATESLAELQASIDAVSASIMNGTVGYPRQESEKGAALIPYRTGGATALTEANGTTAKAALTALYSDTDINLPVPGKAYRIAIHGATGKRWYVPVNGNPATDVTGAATFVCGQDGQKFFFVRNDGSKYMNFNGANTDLSGYGADWNSFSVLPLSANTSSSGLSAAYPAEKRFGYVYILSTKRTASNSNGGCLVVQESDGSWSAANAPFFNGAYTSALTFEEVENDVYVKLTNPNPDGELGLDGKYIGTFSAPYHVSLPSGVKAYTATIDGTTVNFSELGTAVPAGTGVLLFAANADAAINENAVPVGTTTAFSGTNAFLPTTGGDIPEGSYILANKNGHVSFYLINPESRIVAKNKAYLTAPAGSTLSAFRFDFEDTVNGIEELWTNTLPAAPVFDLQGRRVQNAKSGLYIVGGKKVIR